MREGDVVEGDVVEATWWSAALLPARRGAHLHHSKRNAMGKLDGKRSQGADEALPPVVARAA